MTDRIIIRHLKTVFSPEYPATPTEPLDILIEGTDILDIGTDLDISDARVVDGKGCVAIPGLVNTHHHFYQVLTRAIPRMQNAELFPWLVDHYPVWAGIDRECVYWSSLAAMAELIATGCTTTTDHHYLFPANVSPDLIDIQFNAAAEIGIRFLATRGSMSVGKSKGGLPPDHVTQDEDVILADSRRLIRKFHDDSPRSMQRVALAPCSPFSVSSDLMRNSAALAREMNVRLHTHLAETLDEEKYCLKTFGCRPVALMEKLDWIGPDVWFAHCVHLNTDEQSLFGDTGTGVAHCPSSNMRLGSGIAPVMELRAAGAPVGLAVDGSASNDASDMLGEVRQAMFLQRVMKGAGAMTVAGALDMATRGGARVLGFKDMGVLAPNKPADIALFRVDDFDFAGVHDPVGGLILNGCSHRADTVIINGHVVLENGRFTTVNVTEITARVNNLATDLLEKARHKTGIDYTNARA